MLKPSEPSTELTRTQSLILLSRVIQGYEYHPFFYILNLNISARADPPIFPYAHQTELLFRLAFRRPIRILIGDEIGLGKTIEAILIAKFLEKRDGVKRVLVLVPRILVEQWKSELKRFGIHARVVERKNISILAQQGFPAGWYIASIDLAKRDEHRPRITSVDWDVVIVDEAHRVGVTGRGQKRVTERYRLVEELAKTISHDLILLSATPHRGHSSDYISRLKLIDPYLIGEKELDNNTFYKLTHNSIVVRRTKMDVNEIYEHREIFKKARFVARVIGATPMEVEFNELLFQFLRDKLLRYYEYVGEEPKALPLLLALMAKRASSSPFAAMKTLERILRRRSLVVEGKAVSLADASKLDEKAESIVEAYLGLGFEDYDEIGDSDLITEPDEYINKFVEDCTVLLDKQDIEVIEQLFNLAQGIIEHDDSRLKGVFKLIGEHFRKGDKVVVFTEYKDTAQYIYKKLREEIPGIANESALVTSDRIYIPGWDRRERPSIEDLKQYLRHGSIKLIISTDVASEGLNLQVANVIINYEPSWSPVKIEQRLGRVWRLGQEKEVTSYTLFLAIKSDKDVLDILYKKLLAWGRSLQETRATIGEEVVIDMMRDEGPITIPIDVGKGAPSYSEYKALLTYIRDGRSGLERYVQSIINALLSLKKGLEAVGLTRRNMVHKIEKVLSEVLGDFRGSSVDELFKELFIATAKLRGISVTVEGNRVLAGRYTASNTYDLYSNAISILQGVNSLDKPIYVVSSAQLWNLKELHLFQVTIFFEKQPVYSETVGVGVKPGSIELLRGRKLVETVVKALLPDYVVASAHEYSAPDPLIQQFKAIVSSVPLNMVISVATEEFINYVTRLEELNFSFRHADWKPRDMELYYGVYKYIGAIIFTTPHEGGGGMAPPIKVKEVEEVAMKIAVEYERKSGRIPQDVSMNEHFDILSRDPHTGEIRFIEVKGRSGLDLEIELTEPEFRVAQEKGANYWLYIVYGISTGRPRLLAIRDPIRNMVWNEVTVKRYRFKPR